MTIKIITRNNHFLKQDILEEENQVLKLTGFSGSAGTLVINGKDSHLLIDGRYTIQAQKETSGLTIEQDSLSNWLKKNTQDTDKVEIPVWNLSITEAESLNRPLIPNFDINPTAPAQAFEHPLKYSGQSSIDKITQITAKNALLFCLADDVSWLTNLRSNALPHTPILRAMAILLPNGELTLFADNITFPNQKYHILPLSSLENELIKHKKATFYIDYANTPYAVKCILDKNKIEHANQPSPIQKLKAIKNKTELKGTNNAHLRDGVALCKFLSKLTDCKTELEVVGQIQAARQSQKNYYSDSFATIAAFGSNAAIVHYNPTAKTNKKLHNNSLLLIDTGAQYLDGTTDVTRTIALGKPSKEIKDKFTLVLKAHIALANAKFPPLTTGSGLDAVCRAPLWRHGLNFAHGTGHGVGSFLNVHEGPQNISPNGYVGLEKSMVVSIEPGYYQENHFGIRLENLYSVAVAGAKMLNFKALTLVPFDRKLINPKLLNQEEINWLNNYHHKVYQQISKHLTKSEKSWLFKACTPL